MPRPVTLGKPSQSTLGCWLLGNLKRIEIIFLFLYVLHKFYPFVSNRFRQAQAPNFTRGHFWTKAHVNLNSPQEEVKRTWLLSYSYFLLKKRLTSSSPPALCFMTVSSQLPEGSLRSWGEGVGWAAAAGCSPSGPCGGSRVHSGSDSQEGGRLPGSCHRDTGRGHPRPFSLRPDLKSFRKSWVLIPAQPLTSWVVQSKVF